MNSENIYNKNKINYCHTKLAQKDKFKNGCMTFKKQNLNIDICPI